MGMFLLFFLCNPMTLRNWSGIISSILHMCDVVCFILPPKRGDNSLQEKPKKVALQLSEK